jgi:hypothetical protein
MSLKKPASQTLPQVELYLNELAENRPKALGIIQRLLREDRNIFYLLDRLKKQRWTGQKLEWADGPDMLAQLKRADPEFIRKINNRAYRAGIQPIIYY